jgi:hypothetical protein
MLTRTSHWHIAEKMLRKQLEELFGVKLADKKQLIRQEVGGAAAVAKHSGGSWRHPRLVTNVADFS